MLSFTEFYISEEWKNLHRDAIEYFDECLECGRKDRLTVHHRHYRNFGGNETLDDLEVLCIECHKLIHNTDEKYWISIIRRIERLEDDIKKGWRSRPVDMLKKELKGHYDELEIIKSRQGRDFVIIHDCFLCPYSKKSKKSIAVCKCTKHGKFGCYPGFTSDWDD